MYTQARSRKLRALFHLEQISSRYRNRRASALHEFPRPERLHIVWRKVEPFAPRPLVRKAFVPVGLDALGVIGLDGVHHGKDRYRSKWPFRGEIQLGKS